MRDHVARQPMPVEQSILWKPLHDPHYVVASLQLGDGGRRKIFVRQQVLAQVQSAVHTHGRRTLGLLLGRLYQCSATGNDYLVIESVSEQDPVSDEAEMAAVIAEALVERGKRHHHLLGSSEDRGHQVVGWYRGTSTVEAKPSLTTAGVHGSVLNQPWQVTLVVGEGTRGGAFFLRDTVNSRWFYAPFYELVQDAPAQNQPKPTVIEWPEQYITADAVVRARPSPVVAAEESDQQKPYRRPLLSLIRSPRKAPEAQATGTDDVRLAMPSQGRASPSSDVMTPPEVRAPAGLVGPVASVNTPERIIAENRVVDVPPRDQRPSELPARDRTFADRPAPRLADNGFADMPRAGQDEPVRRRARPGEKVAIVDDSDQRSAAPPSRRRIAEDEDTAMGDDPGRFIEIARSEGFFVAARFDTSSETGAPQTLWILNEPYSGLLLAVVTSESEVIDATLHYNLQTDDAGLQRTPFPEYRNSESKTIYARETCMDSLRARCRRLRATSALVKDWKVTPRISFLTPAEWESVPITDGNGEQAASAIRRLNNARIAELPAGIRSQFRLEARGDGAA